VRYWATMTRAAGRTDGEILGYRDLGRREDRQRDTGLSWPRPQGGQRVRYWAIMIGMVGTLWQREMNLFFSSLSYMISSRVASSWTSSCDLTSISVWSSSTISLS